MTPPDTLTRRGIDISVEKLDPNDPTQLIDVYHNALSSRNLHSRFIGAYALAEAAAFGIGVSAERRTRMLTDCAHYVKQQPATNTVLGQPGKYGIASSIVLLGAHLPTMQSLADISTGNATPAKLDQAAIWTYENTVVAAESFLYDASKVNGEEFACLLSGSANEILGSLCLQRAGLATPKGGYTISDKSLLVHPAGPRFGAITDSVAIANVLVHTVNDEQVPTIKQSDAIHVRQRNKGAVKRGDITNLPRVTVGTLTHGLGAIEALKKIVAEFEHRTVGDDTALNEICTDALQHLDRPLPTYHNGKPLFGSIVTGRTQNRLRR